MMSGFQAFDHETPVEFSRKVLSMDWSMSFDDDEDNEPNPFDSISKEGQLFVNQLIVQKPKERLSANEALDHNWLSEASRFVYFYGRVHTET